MASKWSYLARESKRILFNLFCNRQSSRLWLMTEDEHEHYRQMCLDYEKLQAERDMWYNVAQVSNTKLYQMIEWGNANWRKCNEK